MSADDVALERWWSHMPLADDLPSIDIQELRQRQKTTEALKGLFYGDRHREMV